MKSRTEIIREIVGMLKTVKWKHLWFVLGYLRAGREEDADAVPETES